MYGPSFRTVARAWTGREAVAAALLANGAQVDLANKKGATPLSVAARPRLRTASPICVAAAARSCVVCGGLVVAPPVVGCVCCCCCSCCPISQERNEVTSRASEVLRLVVPERVDAS